MDRTINFIPFLSSGQVPYMSGRFDSLAAVLECLAQMESNLLGMKQMRDYVGHGLGRVMLEALIEEAESRIADIKRKLSQ
jgi:hypothetical protein